MVWRAGCRCKGPSSVTGWEAFEYLLSRNQSSRPIGALCDAAFIKMWVPVKKGWDRIECRLQECQWVLWIEFAGGRTWRYWFGLLRTCWDVLEGFSVSWFNHWRRGWVNVCFEKKGEWRDTGVKYTLFTCLVKETGWKYDYCGAGFCWWTVAAGWWIWMVVVSKSVGDWLSGKEDLGLWVARVGTIWPGSGVFMEARWSTSPIVNTI